MKIKYLLLISCVLTFAIFPAYSKSLLMERIGEGLINWQGGYIIVSSSAIADKTAEFEQGRAAAKKEAVAKSYDKIREIINSVMLKNGIQAETTLEGASIENLKFGSDGIVIVTLKLCLFGDESLFAMIYPSMIQLKGEEKTSNGSKPPIIPKKAFSGLIIDARNKSINPSLSPKIVSENGEEIYGINIPDENYAIESGLVSYDTKLSDAKRRKNKVGPKPLLIKASKLTKDSGTDIVLSQKDILKIKKAVKQFDFLKYCKVVFVV